MERLRALGDVLREKRKYSAIREDVGGSEGKHVGK
jgi:hypothetical protein